MTRCNGIINLYYKSKMRCNKVVNDPIIFIDDYIHRQQKDRLYLYLFDDGKYLSLRNSKDAIIKKIDDPTKLVVLWNTYGKKAKNKDRTDIIISQLDEINKMYFNNKYKVDKHFITRLMKEHRKQNTADPLDILLIAIISITAKSKSVSKQIMMDLIAIIHSVLRGDSLGVKIGMDNLSPIIDETLEDINKSLSIKKF